MQLHEIKPKHKKKTKKRIGRGGKRGTYSGRGMKGQKSRAGKSFEPIIRGFIKRYPKLRGYKFGSKGELVFIINLKTLQEKFDDNAVISPMVLLDKKLIHKIKGKMPLVKILGEGDVSKKFVVKCCKISKQAEEKIIKAGGEVKKSKVKKTESKK
ncbi:50S ribosomal protein L15 [Patescibacteria group bacterium]|nr:50S ribosomal protein L15 [Patescibacteria group bacterium]MBU4162449.1 50S ribosomal protein L15 [Patescibacteria group bacterium]